MFYSKPSVQVQMIFQMAKEALDTISGGRYFGIGQIMEHVGKSPFDGEVRTPEKLMGVPVAARLFTEGFLLQISLMAAVPLLQLCCPIKTIILCFDAQQHQHQSPEFYTSLMLWKPCQP